MFEYPLSLNFPLNNWRLYVPIEESIACFEFF